MASASSTETAVNTEQRYGDDPLAVRETDHYQEEYIEGFVDKWDSLIDWDSRAEGEGQFFVDILRARDKHTVLDVATGTGFHSCRLMEEGFDVTSVDGSAEMLMKAFENAGKRGQVLKTCQADWRWLNKDIKGKFDAIFCRNVAIYFDNPTQQKVWSAFQHALNPGGTLFIGHSERMSGPAAQHLKTAGITTYINSPAGRAS